MPLLTSYALTRHAKREPKRLFKRRGEMLDRLMSEYESSERNEAVRPAPAGD
jgi:hypothetical protein